MITIFPLLFNKTKKNCSDKDTFRSEFLSSREEHSQYALLREHRWKTAVSKEFLHSAVGSYSVLAYYLSQNWFIENVFIILKQDLCACILFLFLFGTVGWQPGRAWDIFHISIFPIYSYGSVTVSLIMVSVGRWTTWWKCSSPVLGSVKVQKDKRTHTH